MRGRDLDQLEDQADDGAEPAPLDSDAVGRVPAIEHESIVKAPEQLTPDEAAEGISIALRSRRKWRITPRGDLECPACGAMVRNHERPRLQHIQHHERLESIAVTTGHAAGGWELRLDYAAMHERMKHHAVAWVCVALVLMLVVAALSMALIL